MRLLKFSAEWCGPCKKMKPIVEQVAKDHNLEVVDLDIDRPENQQWVEAYEVQGVPTLVLEDTAGNILGKMVGAQPKSKTEKVLGLV